MSRAILTDDVRLQPWWWEAAPPEAADPGPLPERADVAIVGSGFTGMTAALTLARAGRSVVVLEAEAPGFGASSRNGGMIGSGHRVGFAELAKTYGEDVADEVLREGLRALDYATGLIEDEGIDCAFSRCGRFRGAWRPADYEAMGREADFMRKRVGLEVDMVPRAEQHAEVATDKYHGGCIFRSHGGLHPALFHKGLLERARAAGATVLGKMPVTAIRRDGDGFRVETPRGTLAAREVIAATNGYTGHVRPGLRRRLIPIASYIIATEPLGANRVREAIPGGRMIVETRSRHCYYRPSPDGERILFGGRAALTHIDPARSAAVLRRLLVGLYPDLADVKISHSWLGTLGFSLDHLPHVGADADGVHFALGYSGSGVAMAPYLGWRVANRVLGTADGRTPFDAIDFKPVPLHFGLPIGLPFVDLWYRWKDVLEGS